jgi:hypothetical protein
MPPWARKKEYTDASSLSESTHQLQKRFMSAIAICTRDFDKDSWSVTFSTLSNHGFRGAAPSFCISAMSMQDLKKCPAARNSPKSVP